MPVYANFTLVPGEDGTITIQMAPPVPIGGWDIQFQVTRQYGSSSGIVLASVGSGFNGNSGITIQNSGQGIYNVKIPGLNTSGLDQGDYYYESRRLTSGQNTLLNAGCLLLK